MPSSKDNLPQAQVGNRQLPAFRLLQQLLPVLKGYRYGVGGSLLLTDLGLLEHARDLDLVCVAEDFAAISLALAALNNPQIWPVAVPPHPCYQSEYFTRFSTSDGTEIDLMANIRVQQSDLQIPWHFDLSQRQFRDDIPWMSAEQWLELYQLFQRPERVTLLQRHFAAAS